MPTQKQLNRIPYTDKQMIDAHGPDNPLGIWNRAHPVDVGIYVVAYCQSNYNWECGATIPSRHDGELNAERHYYMIYLPRVKQLQGEDYLPIKMDAVERSRYKNLLMTTKE